MSSNIKIHRICQNCHNEFIARTTVTKYCGDKCAKQAYKARKKAERLNEVVKETEAIKNKPIVDLQSKDFLSVEEVCQLFKVSRTTIWRLTKTGKVNSAKIGRKKFITRASINALFEPEIIIEKQEKPKEFDIKECWTMGEVEQVFGIGNKTLCDAMLRFDIPKMKRGRYVFVPKEEVVAIFGKPK